jgi:hypothetical protein
VGKKELPFVIDPEDFMRKLALFCFGFFVFSILTPPAYAGWSENIRLTYRGNEINPQIIARNDTIHVAWNQSGTGYVSYIRSTDGGATWDSLVNLNAIDHWGNNAKLNLAENGLLISWFDYNDDENISSIAISKSVNGSTWTAPTYVWTDNPNRFGGPVSAVKGDSIFFAYHSNRDDTTGLSPFRSMQTYDYGQTWSDEVTVGYPYVLMPQHIRMVYCGGTLLLAWAGTADPARINEIHIYGYRSTDAGRTWSDTIWISPNNTHDAQLPCLNCNIYNEQLIAGYMDYRFQIYSAYGDIFASTSSDFGERWPFETQTSFHHTAVGPSIFSMDDTLIAAWGDIQFNVAGYPEIVFNRSNDDGHTWQGEYRITYTEGESGAVNVYMDNASIYLVWVEDFPGQDLDLVFKKFTPDSTDAIDESYMPVPLDFSISAYPNPFNSNLTISVESKSSGLLSIYDIQGKIIRQFSFKKGEQRIVWGATNEDDQPVTSGTYFIGRKGDESSTIKVIYLK